MAGDKGAFLSKREKKYAAGILLKTHYYDKYSSCRTSNLVVSLQSEQCVQFVPNQLLFTGNYRRLRTQLKQTNTVSD